MKTKSWFRVVVDGKGKAIDCRPVGSEGTTELGVFFVLADSAEAAAKQAINAQAARLLAARRARYDAEGVCRCGSKRDRPGFKTCKRCSDLHKKHEQRVALRRAGHDVPKPDRRTVLQERKQTEAEASRLDVLEEVRAAWRNHNTVGGFTRWLEAEIAKLAGRKVA
jgi:hypothetical protein